MAPVVRRAAGSSSLHAPLQGPQNFWLAHSLALRNCTLPPFNHPPGLQAILLCVPPALFISLNLCEPTTRPRRGGNKSHPQLLSVLSIMGSRKIQQNLRLH